ncbi:MAG: hypothetical protein NZ899_06310 [Thermoguttaceae bacterium]|nr:hypothetical protein [Thermoguttaceae bacterium]MDW8079227.1 hypothetical protein [Thermoguttaceae bacterium]
MTAETVGSPSGGDSQRHSAPEAREPRPGQFSAQRLVGQTEGEPIIPFHRGKGREEPPSYEEFDDDFDDEFDDDFDMEFDDDGFEERFEDEEEEAEEAEQPQEDVDTEEVEEDLEDLPSEDLPADEILDEELE